MVTIHKIKFPLANNQNEIWVIYRMLKLERKGKNIIEILKEIQENYLEYKEKYNSKDDAFRVLSKIKKTPEKLIKLLNQSEDEKLKDWLREEIKRLVDK